MRPRLVVLASVVTTLLTLGVANAAIAAPSHNNGLTINVTPSPIAAGQGVLIYGQLNVSPIAAQTIILYHNLAGSRQGYVRVAQTTTDSHGFYEFTRAENVVETNRSWFVREAGAHAIHSRTVVEQVSALVSLAANVMSTDTAHPVVFSGHVDPSHSGEKVILQDQVGASDIWQFLAAGRLDGQSNYSISYRFRFPGERNIRVLFAGDDRNGRSASDPVAVTIQQKQIAGFTINSSAPLVGYQQPITISGVLAQPSSTAPETNTPVTLWAWNSAQRKWTPVGDTTTDPTGSYTFAPQNPSYNTQYEVRTTLAPHRHSAELFEGVQDLVSMAASATTSTVGQSITFVGTVLPDKAGHVVYLQLGTDGDWHRVQTRLVQFGSKFVFSWTFGKAGTYQFRARVTGDSGNIGGASTPVTIQVSPATSPAALPPAS
jgi:hypothetical protein